MDPVGRPLVSFRVHPLPALLSLSVRRRQSRENEKGPQRRALGGRREFGEFCEDLRLPLLK